MCELKLRMFDLCPHVRTAIPEVQSCGALGTRLMETYWKRTIIQYTSHGAGVCFISVMGCRPCSVSVYELRPAFVLMYRIHILIII